MTQRCVARVVDSLQAPERTIPLLAVGVPVAALDLQSIVRDPNSKPPEPTLVQHPLRDIVGVQAARVIGRAHPWFGRGREEKVRHDRRILWKPGLGLSVSEDPAEPSGLGPELHVGEVRRRLGFDEDEVRRPAPFESQQKVGVLLIFVDVEDPILSALSGEPRAGVPRFARLGRQLQRGIDPVQVIVQPASRLERHIDPDPGGDLFSEVIRQSELRVPERQGDQEEPLLAVQPLQMLQHGQGRFVRRGVELGLRDFRTAAKSWRDGGLPPRCADSWERSRSRAGGTGGALFREPRAIARCIEATTFGTAPRIESFLIDAPAYRSTCSNGRLRLH